jgi:glycosyltransferase involved in cell wall biosynthesis
MCFATGSPTDPRNLVRSLRYAKRLHPTVLLSRHASPFGQGFPEAMLLKAGSPGIYDLDDGLPFDDGKLPGHKRWWKPLISKSTISHRAVRSADRVIAGNTRLGDWATQFCRDVVVIPTCVEPSDYLTKPSYSLGELPVVGWIGSPATEPHLFGIANSLARAFQKTRFRLVIVSAGNRKLPQPIRHFATRVLWSPEVQHQILSTWDVGLMPLPDLPYEQSKCAYKLLQYGAASLPLIGSPVGASSSVLAKAGAPAPKTSSEWVDAVTDILSASEADRRQLGIRAHEVVRAEYSFETWEERWRRSVT